MRRCFWFQTKSSTCAGRLSCYLPDFDFNTANWSADISIFHLHKTTNLSILFCPYKSEFFFKLLQLLFVSSLTIFCWMTEWLLERCGRHLRLSGQWKEQDGKQGKVHVLYNFMFFSRSFCAHFEIVTSERESHASFSFIKLNCNLPGSFLSFRHLLNQFGSSFSTAERSTIKSGWTKSRKLPETIKLHFRICGI